MQYNNYAHTVLKEYFESETISIEFNKYALINIYEKYRKVVSVSINDDILKYINNDQYSVNIHTWTGNNWLFLRTLIHLKLFILSERKKEWEKFCAYFDYITQLRVNGLFYDFPSRDRSFYYKHKGIPFTYSFKMLSSLIEIYELLMQYNLDTNRAILAKNVIEECVQSHLQLIAPDGETLYYGRSDSTLFGYANVLYVLLALHKSNQDVKIYLNNVVRYVLKNYVKDGIIYRSIAYEGFKDDYIYDGVYVAYFIAKILQAIDDTNKDYYFKYNSHNIRRCQFIRNPAGFIIKGNIFYYFISSSGCHIERNGTDFYGYRYTGLTPLKYYSSSFKNAKSMLQIYRRHIKLPELEIPFVPRIRYYLIDASIFIFEKIMTEENQELFKIKGIGKTEIAFRHEIFRRVFNRLKRLIPKKIYKYVAYIVQIILDNYVLPLERLIIVNKINGDINIIDKSKRKNIRYIIPDEWSIQAEEIFILDKDEDYKIVLTKGGEVNIYSDIKYANELPSSKLRGIRG